MLGDDSPNTLDQQLLRGIRATGDTQSSNVESQVITPYKFYCTGRGSNHQPLHSRPACYRSATQLSYFVVVKQIVSPNGLACRFATLRLHLSIILFLPESDLKTTCKCLNVQKEKLRDIKCNIEELSDQTEEGELHVHLHINN